MIILLFVLWNNSSIFCCCIGLHLSISCLLSLFYILFLSTTFCVRLFHFLCCYYMFLVIVMCNHFVFATSSTLTLRLSMREVVIKSAVHIEQHLTNFAFLTALALNHRQRNFNQNIIDCDKAWSAINNRTERVSQ